MHFYTVADETLGHTSNQAASALRVDPDLLPLIYVTNDVRAPAKRI
eukprot:COSAG02_NODE_9_length_59728_cov_36.104714_68_plen_46_part_00